HEGRRHFGRDAACFFGRACADVDHVGAGGLVGEGTAYRVFHSRLPHAVGAGDDDEVFVATGACGGFDLRHHEFLRHHVFDADVMVRPLRQDLVLDLDGGETRGFGHLHGVPDVHGVAEAGCGVEYERLVAD